MPSTGDRCNDLYALSKAMNKNKSNIEKSKDDYEYERHKDECTFKPTTNVSFLKEKKSSLEPSMSL
jgi:hypothetical protein